MEIHVPSRLSLEKAALEAVTATARTPQARVKPSPVVALFQCQVKGGGLVAQRATKHLAQVTARPVQSRI